MTGEALVSIGGNTWQVAVATTPPELAAGLGGIASIPQGTGMLFDLGDEQILHVTTVPMLFALDIAFIRSDLRVTEVARDVPPGFLVASQSPARYFLEVNSGEALGIAPGDPVTVQLIRAASQETISAPVLTLVRLATDLALAMVVFQELHSMARRMFAPSVIPRTQSMSERPRWVGLAKRLGPLLGTPGLAEVLQGRLQRDDVEQAGVPRCCHLQRVSHREATGLTPLEQEHLARAREMAVSLGARSPVFAASFQDPDIGGAYDGRRILIGQKRLGQWPDTWGTVVHEVAHERSSADDGDHAFLEAVFHLADQAGPFAAPNLQLTGSQRRDMELRYGKWALGMALAVLPSGSEDEIGELAEALQKGYGRRLGMGRT